CFSNSGESPPKNPPGKGLKYCAARSLPAVIPLSLDSLGEAKKEIFFKTLVFYCILVEKGCAFDLLEDSEGLRSTGLVDEDPESDSDSDSESNEHETGTTVIEDCWCKEPRSCCKGKLMLQLDKSAHILDEYGRSLVRYVYLSNFWSRFDVD
ncbi:hypothetical protein K438DRAFT_1835612, partial [Mycena galopus ATCC 62051]